MNIVKFFLSCARIFKGFQSYGVKSKILNLAILHHLAVVTHVHPPLPLPLIWFCDRYTVPPAWLKQVWLFPFLRPYTLCSWLKTLLGRDLLLTV